MAKVGIQRQRGGGKGKGKVSLVAVASCCQGFVGHFELSREKDEGFA
jgi:hypothetical protein